MAHHKHMPFAAFYVTRGEQHDRVTFNATLMCMIFRSFMERASFEMTPHRGRYPAAPICKENVRAEKMTGSFMAF